MRISIKVLALSVILLLGVSCKEDIYEVYEINDLEVLPVNAQKNKAKTDAQYISILYTNFFQTAIGPNNMLQAQQAVRSIGDKQIAFDMLVSRYLNLSPDLPTKEEMFADPEKFIRDTYTRFFTRQPTEAELAWMMNYFQSTPDLTPDVAYLAFATCNEHYFY